MHFEEYCLAGEGERSRQRLVEATIEGRTYLSSFPSQVLETQFSTLAKGEDQLRRAIGSSDKQIGMIITSSREVEPLHWLLKGSPKNVKAKGTELLQLTELTHSRHCELESNTK